MTIEDMILDNVNGNDDSKMRRVARLVSEYVEAHTDDKSRHCLKRKVYGVVCDGHYNREYAEEDIARMSYRDDNGMTRQGPFFTEDETRKVFDRHKDDLSDYCLWDFAVVMNMIRSDYNRTLERFSTDEKQMREIVESLSVEYLQNDDARYPTSKIWHYLNG